MAPPTSRTFDDLVAEGAAVPTEGWDFSWFEGRATEARPSWGYARALGGRLAGAGAVLDVQTGGGEVLDFALGTAAPGRPALLVATEGWPPNVAKATALLRPRGVPVVASPDDAPFPFADGAFDLVVSRHPVVPHWSEIARVLAPGGTYFAQHVGPASVFEVVEFFLGPQPEESRDARHPDGERADAEAAGLEVVDLRAESGCGWSSTTSAPSSTSCARSCGWCPGSPSRRTGTGSASCTSASRPRGRSSPTARGISSRPGNPVGRRRKPRR